MRLTLKSLDGRTLSSITTPCSRMDWICEVLQREYGATEDDITCREDDALGDVVCVDGSPIARVVSEFGWRANGAAA